MIIECPYCQANVDGKVLTSHESFDPEADPFAFRASLLECPVCKSTLLAGQSLVDVDFNKQEWDSPSRIWPSPKRYYSWSIPNLVRVSLEEAERCLRAGAYIGCAAMCGRALEAICRHHETKSPYLGDGLKELLDREVIDKRLYQWSQELQRQRNIAAHATEDKISKADAENLLDFVNAISEYIFVLTDKFAQFMERKKKKESKKQA